MEVDGEMTAPFWERSDPLVSEVAALSTQQGEEQSQDPEGFKGKEEFTRMCRPLKFDGRGGPDILEDFINSLEEYFSFFSESVPEKKKVYLASRQLEGEAWEWWRSSRQGLDQTSNVTLQGFINALTVRFTPKSVREQLREQLKALKQKDMPADTYIAKFRALARRSHSTDEEFLCEQFILGLSSVPQTAVSSWVSARSFDRIPVRLEHMIEFLRIHEKVVPSPQALARINYLNPDIEPMDIGAVATRPPKPQKNRNQKGKDSAKKQPGNEKEQRKCFACGKPGHLIKECRFLKSFKEQHGKEQAQRKQAAQEAKKKRQGNTQAPTQPAAQ